MKITKVTYAALANLGNYENERIELEATIGEGDSYEEVLADLTQKVHEQLKNEKDYYQYCHKYNDAQRRLKEITEKLQKAYDQWEETSNFLVAQGLKPSVPSFPIERQKLIAAGIEEVEPQIEPDYDEIPI